MNNTELFTTNNLSLFIAVGSLFFMILLFLGDRRKLTAKRLIALRATCLLGFMYYLNHL